MLGVKDPATVVAGRVDVVSLPDFFDRRAADRQFWAFTLPQNRTLRQFEYLWGIRRGEDVLEVGCGAGRLTERLADAVGMNGRVRACDVSAEMVARARQRCVSLQVEVVWEAASSIGAEDAVFDKIICLNSFHFFATQEAVAELARVLRPGGRLWICQFESRQSLNRHFEEKGERFGAFRLPDTHVLSAMCREGNLHVEKMSDDSDACWVEVVKGLSS